jgi:hypothetical protein
MLKEKLKKDNGKNLWQFKKGKYKGMNFCKIHSPVKGT